MEIGTLVIEVVEHGQRYLEVPQAVGAEVEDPSDDSVQLLVKLVMEGSHSAAAAVVA